MYLCPRFDDVAMVGNCIAPLRCRHRTVSSVFFFCNSFFILFSGIGVEINVEIANTMTPALAEWLQKSPFVSKNASSLLTSSPIAQLIALIALAYCTFLIARTIISILHFIFVYFIRPSKNLKFYGSWALVTGATDGIGKAYCVELAKKGTLLPYPNNVDHTYHFHHPSSPNFIHTGLNLIIVSRTQSRLDDLAQELSSKYNIQVRTFAADLTKIDVPTLDRLSSITQGLDVGILINNAGMSYNYPEFLDQTEPSLNIDLITINTIAPTLLAAHVLQGMKERGRGVIVNIGSANGLLPSVPLLSVYAGSKAYVNQFTRSLDRESRGAGVRVHDQCPMFVATKMSKIRRARLDAPTPGVWAKAAVRQIGYEAVLTPYWYHGLMNAVIGLAPTWVVEKYVHTLHLGFRASYFRKLARQQQESDASKGDVKKRR